MDGTGKGPRKWGHINPHWKACGNGKLQSPIDILDQRVQVFPNMGKLKRDYQPARATVKNRGHDISCHWHSPAEHTFNGSRYNQELHLVHENSNGGLAVVAIIYKLGRPNHFLSQLLPHIPEAGKEEKDVGIVNPGMIKFGSRKYYRYIGSLTVPPCTEGIKTVSKEQVRALRELVHDGFEANARPLQKSDGRDIWLYSQQKTLG
ncbi:hypothetical protein ACFE04_011946 [Oxalis oulophora]